MGVFERWDCIYGAVSGGLEDGWKWLGYMNGK
jgi:hypothetical protein